MFAWLARRRLGTVEKLVADANAWARAEAAKGNWLQLDRGVKALTITTVIKGEPLAWIEFDGPQLDRLIECLQNHRAALRKKGPTP